MRNGRSFHRMQQCRAFLKVLPLLITISASAQQLAYESPAKTKFLLYTPPGYSTSNVNHPLLISLHSKGELGDDLTLLTSRNREQMPSRLIYLNRWPTHLPFVVLTPQLKPDENGPDTQWPAGYIDEVVEYVLANFRIDEQRIYLTGISRGGTGAWAYASAFPEKIAAMVPISGRSDLTQACPIKNIPVWAFHGDGDAVAPRDYSVDMVNAIKACAPRGLFTPRLDLLNARDHNGWNEIYNGTSGYDIWSWLLMFRKHDSVNKKPYVDAGRDLRMQVRSAPIHLYGDFFDWDGAIAQAKWTQISGTPLTLSGTTTKFLQITTPKAGTFQFQLDVTDDRGARSTDIVALEITGSPVSPAITRLILLDGKTNTELGSLSEGQLIDKRALGITEINIRAVTSEGTESVRFSVNSDDITRLKNTDAYYIKTPSTYPEWQVISREYLICATPYSKTYGAGTPGISQCYKVTVTDDATLPTGCPGAGTITREIWTGITGRYTSSIPLNSSPSAVAELTSFETPRNAGDNYGSRVRGYVCAPATGDYVFWIASDDTGELWLSTDDNPANKRKITSVSGWTNFREWSKYTSQQSVPIRLVAGNKYYVEALHKEATGGDHLSIGWQLPDATMERPIPGNRLLPFKGSNFPAPCEGGTIGQETWLGITGRDISSIPTTTPPSTVAQLTSFEAPRNIADNYGSRIRGYVCVPSTGNYTFWIASDDTGELWLSTDENPSNKRRIAFVSGWTYSNQWTKYTTQQSTSIYLIAGRRYYVEALLKEATGGDHLSIGWSLPDGTLERPIPGNRLSPWETSTAFSSTAFEADRNETIVDPTQRENEADLHVYPNPIFIEKSNEIALVTNSEVGLDYTVEVLDLSQRLVMKIDGQQNSQGDLRFQLANDLKPGVYFMIVTIGAKRFSKRLLIR